MPLAHLAGISAEIQTHASGTLSWLSIAILEWWNRNLLLNLQTLVETLVSNNFLPMKQIIEQRNVNLK